MQRYTNIGTPLNMVINQENGSWVRIEDVEKAVTLARVNAEKSLTEARADAISMYKKLLVQDGYIRLDKDGNPLPIQGMIQEAIQAYNAEHKYTKDQVLSLIAQGIEAGESDAKKEFAATQKNTERLLNELYHDRSRLEKVVKDACDLMANRLRISQERSAWYVDPLTENNDETDQRLDKEVNASDEHLRQFLGTHDGE